MPNGPIARKNVQIKKQHLIAAYASGGNVSEAVRQVGVGRRTHYDWLQEDQEYAQAFEDARQDAGESLVAEARRRAIAGSDTLLIFLIKGAFPEVYRERHEVTGKGGGPLVTVLLREGEDVP